MKALVLSFVLAMICASPASAQRSDDFFRVDENQYDNRVEGVIWGTIITQDPTTPAPLDSGLLIMVAAGAGYAVARRKRSIRRGTTLLLAFALLLGMTQCKKNVETIKTVEGGIPMTLEAYNGSRTSFDGSGAISWGTNEVIYVVYNGSCIGSVTNGAGGGTTFTGSVTGLESGNEYTLHYYYVGTEKTIATNATSFTMDFVNQDGSLANLGKFHIGYGTQTLTYEGGSITSVAGLRSLVSIGYFNIAGMAEVGEKVYMYGENINNRISIDFSTNTITNTKGDPSHDENLICLGAVAEGAICGKYVMLVPNHTDGTETLATDITFISKRTTGTCNGSFPYGIVDNRFYCEDGEIGNPIEVAEAAYDKCTLRGEFTVNDSDKKVRFSQGNLQAVGTISSSPEGGWTWQFATNQYTAIKNAAANTTISGKGTLSADGTVDLFGYSTDHYNNFFGIIKSTRDNYYSDGPTSGAFVDWGVNSISGCAVNYWYTMAKSNWEYLLNTRESPKFAKVSVNGVYGLLLFPDNFTWNATTMGGVPSTVDNKSATYNSTNCSISLEKWNVLEASGVVFLPGTGFRSQGAASVSNISPARGYYWFCDTNGQQSGSGTTYDNNSTFYLYFGQGNIWSTTSTLCKRSGAAVRLVHDVPTSK